VLILSIPLLGVLLALPLRINNNGNASRAQPQLDVEFAQGVEFLKQHPGPALCENLLMCYEGGKPHFYDAFFVNDQMKIGRIQESEIVAVLSSEYFKTIQIAIRSDQPLSPGVRDRFSAAAVNVILEHYHAVLRASEFALLVPNEGNHPGH
jgi:hypothetical protein